jgi:hypothetical protein
MQLRRFLKLIENKIPSKYLMLNIMGDNSGWRILRNFWKQTNFLMPRKKPYSGKQKKLQLKEKKRRKQNSTFIIRSNYLFNSKQNISRIWHFHFVNKIVQEYSWHAYKCLQILFW